ncbi:MAG: glycosyltransferase family 4 protein [Acidimicrobiales bacterium]
MRVLVSFEQVGPVDGITRGVLETAEVLHRRGHEFLVAFRVEDSFLARWDAMGSRRVPVPGFEVSRRHPWKSSVGRLRSVRRVRHPGPDVVSCNQLVTLPFSVAVARRFGVPLVVHIKQSPPLASSVFLRYLRRLLARASATAYVSAHLKAVFEADGLTAPGGTVIPEGLDTGVYRPPTPEERRISREGLELEGDQRLVLYLGRIDPDKGIETLFEAVKRMHDRRVVVVLAGEATVETFRRGGQAYAKRLTSYAHPPGVRFVGRQDDTRALLWAADVVAVPSVWSEPLGRVPLEAMACGIPVVASRVGGLPEIFSGDLDEFLVPATDPDGLASALAKELFEAPPDAAKLQQLRANVVENFNLDTVAASVESMMLGTGAC